MNYDKLLEDLKELHKEMLEQGNTVESDYILNRAIPTVEKRKIAYCIDYGFGYKSMILP